MNNKLVKYNHLMECLMSTFFKWMIFLVLFSLSGKLQHLSHLFLRGIKYSKQHSLDSPIVPSLFPLPVNNCTLEGNINSIS